MLKRRKAADHQAGADEEHQGQRHLRDHQHASNTCVDQRRRACRAQRAIQVHPCRPERGHEAEEERRDRAGGEREQQDGAVDPHGLEPRQVCGAQPIQDTRARPGREQPDDAAGHRKDRALGGELAKNAHPRGAERAAQGNLALAAGRASEQQVCDVGAGDQQQEADGDEEHHQRAPRVLDDILLQRNDPDAHVSGLVLGMLRAKLSRDAVHVRLGLLERHLRLEPPEHREERQVAWQLRRVVELQRLPDLRVGDLKRLRRQPQPEARRHDSDHGLIETVQPDPTTHDARIAAVPAPPQVVTENHDLRTTHRFFFRGEVTSVGRIHTEQREEIRRDRRDFDAFRLDAVSRQRADRSDHLRARAGGKNLEGLAALLVVPEVTWRHRGQGLRADPEVHPDVRDPLGRSVWQGSQQDAVHDREDRRRRAYAEAQRHDGYRRETWASNQRPQRVSNILPNSRHASLIADSADQRRDE